MTRRQAVVLPAVYHHRISARRAVTRKLRLVDAFPVQDRAQILRVVGHKSRIGKAADERALKAGRAEVCLQHNLLVGSYRRSAKVITGKRCLQRQPQRQIQQCRNAKGAAPTGINGAAPCLRAPFKFDIRRDLPQNIAVAHHKQIAARRRRQLFGEIHPVRRHRGRKRYRSRHQNADLRQVRQLSPFVKYPHARTRDDARGNFRPRPRRRRRDGHAGQRRNRHPRRRVYGPNIRSQNRKHAIALRQQVYRVIARRCLRQCHSGALNFGDGHSPALRGNHAHRGADSQGHGVAAGIQG